MEALDARRARALHRRPPGLRRRAERRGLRPRGPVRATPPGSSPRRPRRGPSSFGRLHGLVAAVGARPVAIDAARARPPDGARVAPAPRAGRGADQPGRGARPPSGREALRSAGPSFTDLTRVAGSNPPLWADILLANREAVLRGAGGYRGAPGGGRRALARGDRDWLLGFVGDAGRGARAAARAGERAARRARRAWWWRSRTARARSPRSPPPSATPTSTSRTSAPARPPGGRGRAGAGAGGPRGGARGRAPRRRARLAPWPPPRSPPPDRGARRPGGRACPRARRAATRPALLHHQPRAGNRGGALLGDRERVVGVDLVAAPDDERRRARSPPSASIPSNAAERGMPRSASATAAGWRVAGEALPDDRAHGLAPALADREGPDRRQEALRAAPLAARRPCASQRSRSRLGRPEVRRA